MEIKTLKVGDHVLELKNGLTGREERLITQGLSGKEPTIAADGEISNVDVNALTIVLDEAIKVIVLSFDGKANSDTFSVLDAILDLPAAEYHQVQEAVSNIVAGKDFLAD